MDTTLDTGIVPFDVVGFLSRRRILMTWVFTLTFAFGLLVTLLLPSVYRSTATILIEQQEIPEELVRSTVTSFADQRIEMISQRVMTTTNLWEIIEKFDLYAEDRKRKPREYIIENMRSDINRNVISADVVDPRSGRPVQATIAFSIAFDAASPMTAQRVANELTSLFLKENIKTRSDMADQAEKFLADEAEKLRQQIKQYGEGIANFKAANQDSLPEVQMLNIAALQRIEQDLRDVDRDLGSLDERKLYLESELAKQSPHDRMITDSGAAVMSPLGRLKVLETQGLQMLSQYSASHPDVQRTDREIAGLRKQLGYSGDNTAAQQQVVLTQNELAVARKRYGDQHPEVKRLQRELQIAESAAGKNVAASSPTTSEGGTLFEPDSPAWLQIKASINGLESQQKTLQQKKAELRRERTTYDQRMAAAPNVEKTYREMLADIEGASAKYNEIKAKQAEAKLGKALETEQKGERFTLIEPPLQPETPVKPKRLVLFFVSFVLSALLTIAAGYLLEMADKSIKDAGAVERLAGQAPLAIIPYIRTEAEGQRDRTQWIIVGIGLLVALLSIVISVHYFYKPLDVLYYLVMRRYGL